MKRRIELNGLANIHAILQLEADIKDGVVVMNPETIASIENQLNTLERYMLAYNDAIIKGVETPYWHEVRDNPTKFPLNRERK